MCNVCGSRAEYVKVIHKQHPITEFCGRSFNFCLIADLADRLKDPAQEIDLNNFLVKSCGCIHSAIAEEYTDEDYTRLFKVIILPSNLVCMGNGSGIYLPADVLNK